MTKKINKYHLELGRYYNLKSDPPEFDDINLRYRHTHIMGATGGGKTTLMERMAMYDIEHGCACIFIDPKGVYAKRLYSLIKDKSRVTYLSLKHPTICINPLRKEGYPLNSVVEEFVDILNIHVSLISPDNILTTNNMRDVLWHTVKVIKSEDREIKFIQEFLRYPDVRRKYFNQHYRGIKPQYWIEYDKPKGTFPSSEAQTGKSLAIRLGMLTNDEALNRIITGKNTLNIKDIAENKKVVLIDLSNTYKGHDVLLTALTTCAIKSYCKHSEAGTCSPLMFYHDECWMGLNTSFRELLNTGRDYSLGLNLGHQSIDDFVDNTFRRGKIFSMIHSLCRNKITFQLPSREDSKPLSEPHKVNPVDIEDLEPYWAYINIHGKRCCCETYPPLEVDEIIEPEATTPPQEESLNFLRPGSMSMV